MERRKYKVNLHSNLSKFSSNVIEIYATDLRDIFQGLASQFGEEFKETILNGAWHIKKGNISDDNYILDSEIDFPVMEEELHIFPAIVGSGGGMGRIIFGVVLLIVAVVMIWNPLGWAAFAAGGSMAGVTAAGAVSGLAASVALAGIAAIAGGVMSMLTKAPSTKISSGTSTDRKESFIFNGAVNNVEQGVPIPRVYGIHLTGSTVISAGIDTHRI